MTAPAHHRVTTVDEALAFAVTGGTDDFFGATGEVSLLDISNR